MVVGRDFPLTGEDRVGVFVKSKRKDKLGWGLQHCLDPFFGILQLPTPSSRGKIKRNTERSWLGGRAFVLFCRMRGELETSGGLWSVVQK